MSSENTTDLSAHVASPWTLLLSALLWSVGAACALFTTCYAYHIGL